MSNTPLVAVMFLMVLYVLNAPEWMLYGVIIIGAIGILFNIIEYVELQRYRL